MIASAPLTALAEANITPESPARIGRVDIAQMPADASFTPPLEIAKLVDPNRAPEDVIASADSVGFAPVTKSVPQYSSKQGDIWFRFELTNSSAEIRSAKLVMRFAYLERADLFEVRPDGKIRQSTAGSAVPVAGDAVAAAYPAFQILIPPGESREYFGRIRSATMLLLPISIQSEANFTRQTTFETLIWSLITGAALAFAIYAGSMSFTTANGAFRIYVCFAISAALYILFSSGLLTGLIGMHSSFNFTRIVFFAQALVIAFGAMFIMAFLDMQRQAPRLFRMFYGIALAGVLSGLGFLLPEPIGRITFFLATGIGPLAAVTGLGIMAASGVAGARSVLIAWLPSLLATVWIYLRLFNLTPYLPINHFLLPIAFAFTLAYLSAVLGGKVRQAEFWANTDPMTGLGNRRLLDHLCDLESRQPGERYGAAVAIDLDKFKPVNDTYGHPAGDAVLVAVAEKLRMHFGGRGDIFRVGGDEFLVLGYHWQSRMEIISQANAFLQAMQTPLRHENVYLTVGASIGIAFYDHRSGFAGMLRQSDAELYHVKSSAKGGIRIADQRKRDRRRTEPVLFADNDAADEHIAKMFGNTRAR